MKNCCLLLFLLVLSNASIAQNSNEFIELSISYLKQDSVAKFNETYSKIYDEYLKENLDDYQEAVRLVDAGDTINSIKKIENLTNEGYFLDEIVSDKNFLKLHHTKTWNSIIIKKIDSIKKPYNNSLRLKLKEIQKKDQSIRLLFLYARTNHSQNKNLIDKIRNKMKIIDVESGKLVQQIIDNYGWLGKNVVGSEANETLFLAIQHLDDTTVQNKYLPILEKAVSMGDAEPWHFAFLTDRVLMNLGKKQIYGTQIILSKNPEIPSFLVPLENPDAVDELRNKIGLEPLSEYLKDDGIEWNIEKYKEELSYFEKLYRERYENKKDN